MGPTDADFAVRVFCMKTAREIANLRGHQDSVNYVDVSTDGRWLASVSDDRTLRIWEIASGRMAALVAVEGRPLWCAFHSSGESIAIASTGWRADLRLVPRTFSLGKILMPAAQNSSHQIF
jgi:WD40 repeat protein